MCYILRVYNSIEHLSVRNNADVGGDGDVDSSDDAESGDSSADSESDDGDSNDSAETTIDIFRNARNLFPWHGSLKTQVKEFWESVADSHGDEVQLEKLQAIFRTLIFQHVRGETFKSALLQFLAVLGIDEDIGRLRQANDFSYMLAGVVYCVRVLAAEILLPAAEREQQGNEDDKRFRCIRDEYLADGSYSVMSKMLSLLAYGKSLALNHGNAGAVFWSHDGSTMSYRGRPIVIARFRRMVVDVVAEAEDMLWRDLM